MVDLPKKKVGIIACSGEEIPEGTVTRLAALKVLEDLRPDDTVTICLPLFLAGGEGDRAFARFYPTIAIDGCEKRCAAKGTEKYSSRPAANIIVSELVANARLDPPAGHRVLNDSGILAVNLTAEQIVGKVDELLGRKKERSQEHINIAASQPNDQTSDQKTCACGSGIPIMDLIIDGEKVTIIALPLIFENLLSTGKYPEDELIEELIKTVKIYNPIPLDAEEIYGAALLAEYRTFYLKEKSK